MPRTSSTVAEPPTPKFPSPARLCDACLQTGSRHCPGCGNAMYCSQDCQDRNKPMHSVICESFTSLPPRPSVKRYRAILLPTTEDKPRFVWLEYQADGDKTRDGGEVEVPKHDHLQSLMGVDRPYSMAQIFDCQRQPGRDLEHHVYIAHNLDYASDGSAQSRSLQNFLGQRAFKRCGPFLAHGTKGTLETGHTKGFPRRGPGYDLETRHIRHIIEDFWSRSERHGMQYPHLTWLRQQGRSV